MLENILAKPQESLTKHTLALYNVWLELKRKYEEIIPEEKFWYYSLISVFFHDFGKIADNFQEVISNKKRDYSNYVRHEFVSGMFLFANSYKDYEQNSLSLFAIFSHHKKLENDLFSKESNIDLKINLDYVKEFVEFATKEIDKPYKNKFQINQTAIGYLQNKYFRLLEDYQKRVYVLTKKLAQKDRIEYVKYKAILQIADWTASGHNELQNGITYDEKYLSNKITEKINQTNKKKKLPLIEKIIFKKFQTKSNIAQNVIAIAPTGSGKTEAALLWASKKNENQRIIYLLPTKVTSNAIFERLTGYFGNEYVTVIHSSAFFFHKEIQDSYEKKDYLLDKTFFKNINICTVDQVLTQGFNLGYWEIKTFHLLNAKIIIDEIHLYEPYTLGLIISTIYYLQKDYGATFYIMTATMPFLLKNLLRKYLTEPIIIEDTELLKDARNEFVVKDYEIKDADNEILEAVNQLKKILIVVNTVDSAIDQYKKMVSNFKDNNTNIMCYHSRFIQKDRQEKEKNIFELEKSNSACILVATQVVEVSLDIDFDILFTENAPIDAIIQRAGRINRKRKKENTKVIIYKYSEITAKWVYTSGSVLKDSFDVLKKQNNKRLSEEKLTMLVDEVYKNVNIEDDFDFKKGLNMYNEEQLRLSFIKDNTANENTMTRLNIDTINVIPACFEEYLYDKSIEEKAKHELSVRKSKEYSFEIYSDENKQFKYIKADYDYEYGLVFEKKSYKATHFL
jgi:CRISPR-associated endonuclease/helicase Cas3